MTWGCAPYCAFAIWLLTQSGPPGFSALQPCCMATTILILHLHHAATAMGTTASSPQGFSSTQHTAVHFALAFFVLSELKYHRQWLFFLRSRNYRASFLATVAAGNDSEFNVLRDCMAYNFNSPHVLGATALEGLEYFCSIKNLGTLALSCAMFYFVGGCMNYPIKLLANPGPEPYTAINFLRALAQINVLFDSNDAMIFLLNFCITHRVARHANFIVFWGIVNAFQPASHVWNNEDTVANEHELLPCSSE